jgi:vacuolar-type H+-ATPase subunit E/Vma4
LSLSDQRDNLGGGFVLKRGKIKTNVSFEVLLAQARKDLEIELAKELFL